MLRNTEGEQLSTSHRRKPPKRRLVHSDDDEGDGDDDDAPVPAKRTKHPRTVDTDASLTVATTTDDDDDMDVDVETYCGSAQRSLSADDGRFLSDNALAHDRSPPRKARVVDPSKKYRKLSIVSASTKKKPQLAHSDDEDDSVDEFSDSIPPIVEPSDNDFEDDTPPKRGASKAKVGITKNKAGQLNGTKTKGPEDKDKEKEREIFLKDERKLAAPPTTTSRASSIAAQSQPSELFSNEEHSVVDALPEASQPPKDPLSQAIPRKRKLPPIKKTKANNTTGTSTPTTATQKPPPPPQEVAKPLPTSEQRKQALTGVRDVDLGDSKIYAELFKGAGGNTPRSGLKNAEGRRKELDKMRDKARVRRNEEAKFTFDLQRQADKIAYFEQRLRAENSTVLHPNFLAAKLRDEWELDRRNRRVSDTPKEEGEA